MQNADGQWTKSTTTKFRFTSIVVRREMGGNGAILVLRTFHVVLIMILPEVCAS